MKYLFYFILLLPIQLFCKGNPDSLQTIDLQHKNLKVFPQNFEYAKIQTLHVGYNPLTKIPSELITAKNLKQLSINYNTQFDLEASIPVIKQLNIEVLSINNSNLMYLPLEIGEMKTLKHLSLSNNFIREIPEYVFIHADLTSLNISGNLISKLPKEINSQNNLTSLDISKNACINSSSTYQNLFPLTNLKQLEVRGSSTLPTEIWNLKSLEKLDISEGTFEKTDLPKDAHKHNLTQLTANDCNLMDFSTLLPVLSCPTLREISLGGEKFNGFSNAGISTAVTHLTLSGTNLEHFTFSGALISLQELALNFTSINCKNELMHTLSKAGNVKTLNLTNCNITELPSQLKILKNLETLNLSGNKITSVNELFSLKQLLVLDVSLCGLSKEQLEKLKKELPTTTIICNEPFSKAPLQNATVATENFRIIPTQAQTIITQNGTVITIPKNSLVFDNGKIVKEPVTINYTPYYSLTDIALSGINMNYESKETNAPFSSAGMFNINANVNGQNVSVKKGSEIKVEFKSNDPDQSYNYYSYDSITKNWATIGKDSVTKIKVAKSEDTMTVSANPVITSQNMTMPQPPLYFSYHPISISWELDNNKKINGRFSISSDLPKPKEKNDTSSNKNYFTEIKVLSAYTWMLDTEKASARAKQFMKENKLFNTNKEQRPFKQKPRFYDSETDKQKMIEFELVADKENDNFIFRFYDETDTVIFNAYPVLQTKNADKAQKTIKKIFFKYQEEATARKQLTKYRKNRFDLAYQRYKEMMASYRSNIARNQEADIANLLNTKVATNSYGITRVLSLQGFGTFNCDRPVIIQNPIVIKPKFYNEKGQRITNVNFQVVDPKENIVVSYYSSKEIRVSRNSLITFINTENTAQQRVYVGKLKTFDLRSGSIDIKLSAVPPDVSLGQLSEFINSTQ